jgi:hypothetical protein
MAHTVCVDDARAAAVDVLAVADAFARAASELLDVDVDQLARPGAFVTLGLLTSTRESLPSPSRLWMRLIVEIGRPSVWAISQR